MILTYNIFSVRAKTKTYQNPKLIQSQKQTDQNLLFNHRSQECTYWIQHQLGAIEQKQKTSTTQKSVFIVNFALLSF